jgi:hypothetical protein
MFLFYEKNHEEGNEKAMRFNFATGYVFATG